jgi:hypothetical protein
MHGDIRQFGEAELTSVSRHRSPWLWGGVYYDEPPQLQEPLAIADQLLKCVVFLCADFERPETPGDNRRTPVGTAIAVSLAGEDGEPEFRYLVTTGYALEQGRRRGELIVRFNMKDGTTRDIPTDPQKEWFGIDVAVNWLCETPDGADIQPLPLSSLVTQELTKSRGLEEGADLLAVSPFQLDPESSRTKPLVRLGKSYLMPQLVATRPLGAGSTPMEIEAYLAEWRSWGGPTGSPVFVHTPLDGDNVTEIALGPQTGLLGLVHTHMNIDQELELSGETLAGGTIDVDYGVSVVVPAQRIFDVLMMDELELLREQSRHALMMSRLA